jgi:hypothetical protein
MMLGSLISDLTHAAHSGQLTDRDRFDRDLLSLDGQWQEIVRRAAQRKAVVDQRLAMWQTYQLQSELLQERTAEFRLSFPKQDPKVLLTVSQMQQRVAYCLVSYYLFIVIVRDTFVQKCY